MSHKLADIATEAVTDKVFTSTRLMCQRFARQCVQSAYGSRFDQFHAPSAYLAAKRWNKTKWSLPHDVALLPGDLIYWSHTPSNPFGHVAIYVGRGMIAHNSTVNKNAPNRYKGISHLSEMRPYHVVVRLPSV